MTTTVPTAAAPILALDLGKYKRPGEGETPERHYDDTNQMPESS